MNRMTIAYLEAALFTETDDAGLSLDTRFDIKDFRPAALVRAQEDCDAFLKRADHLVRNMPFERVGRYLWYTRNRHGTGFWDDHYLSAEQGRKATTVAHQMGEISVQVLGDNTLEFVP